MKKNPSKIVKKKFNWNFDIAIGGISTDDLLFFSRHLSLSLKSGLTLFDALTMLQDQASGTMKKVLYRIMKEVEAGEPFYKALEQYPQYFSPLYIHLVKTGEVSGTLEANLNYLGENLQKNKELKQKVKSAMIYPAFILVAIIGLGFSIAIFVLPKIVPLFKTLDVELPATTRGLIFLADVFSNHGVAISVGMVVFLLSLYSLLKQNFIKPFTHRLLFYIPIVKGIVRNVNLEMFCHTLGTLLVSGIPVDKSLKITGDATENRMYRKVIHYCSTEVQKGNTLSSAFEHYPGYIPKIMKHMVAMGEKTGNLDTTLKYISQFYESEVDTTMKNLSTIIEPVLLIFIGLMVGTVAMAILGPIYKITGRLNG